MIFIPALGSNRIIARARLFLALAVSFILTPIISSILPLMPEKPIELAIVIMGEIIVGAFLGLVIRAMYTAVQTAGTVFRLFRVWLTQWFMIRLLNNKVPLLLASWAR